MTIFTIPFNGPDLKIEPFKGSGPGGMNRNKNSTAIRVRHIPSGVVVEAQEYKSQKQNKKAAIQRLIDHKKFKLWLRVECSARLLGYQGIDDKIDKSLTPRNLKVEVFKDGKWTDRP
jgi:hypothetical protein